MTYNHITLIGTLKEDPVTEKIGKKDKATFTIAVERYIGKDKPSEIDYFNIVTWGKLAEICGEHLKAMKKVLVDGIIQIRKLATGGWITEIVAENIKFLSNKI